MAITMKDVSKIEIPDNGYRELEYIAINGQFFDLGTTIFTYCFEVDANINFTYGYATTIFGFNYNPGESGTTHINARIAQMTINSSGEPDVYFGKKEKSSSHMGSVSLTSIGSSIDEKRCLYRMYVNGNGINLDVEDSSGTLIKTGSDTYSSDAIGSEPAALCGIYKYSTTYSRYGWTSNFGGKLYSFKVRSSKGGQLLQEWVPAQRKTDSKNGLYNTLSGEFILPYTYVESTNTKTQSSATAGPVVNEDPDWIQKYEVKKIVVKSSNTMIWGSQAEYPYRRLEYVHFSGAEYFDTQFGTKQGYYREVTFALNQLQSGNSMIMGSLGPSSDNNNLRRCYNCLVGSDGRFRYTVGNASSSWQNASNLPLNTKRVTYFNIQQDNSTYNAKMNWGLKDASGNTLVSGSTTAGATGYLSNTSMSVMANNSDGNRDSFAIGNVYEIIERQTSSSGSLKHRYIPCQRKSDNVCGFYDVVDATFRAITGTNVTTAAAGPVVNEYWDLTV